MEKKSPSEALTERVTALEVVTLALYVLGGGRTAIDTEDVAMQAEEIAPGRFAWRKYPSQINLELVRVALSDASKPGSSLVFGSGRTGWSLTEAGQRWAEVNAEDLLERPVTTTQSDRTAGSIDEQRRVRERSRVLASDGWQQWNGGAGSAAISDEAASEVFRIDRYVLGRSKQLKVNRLREMFADDPELAPFIDAAAEVIKER